MDQLNYWRNQVEEVNRQAMRGTLLAHVDGEFQYSNQLSALDEENIGYLLISLCSAAACLVI